MEDRRPAPGKSVLHEAFRRGWPEVSSSMPPRVKLEVERYLKCGELRYGFVAVTCEACAESRVVAFCCKSRGYGQVKQPGQIREGTRESSRSPRGVRVAEKTLGAGRGTRRRAVCARADARVPCDSGASGLTLSGPIPLITKQPAVWELAIFMNALMLVTNLMPVHRDLDRSAHPLGGMQAVCAETWRKRCVQ
ncbi:MAG: transposase zinc-binding domain-containing protein [Archangium sp.]|nr:transposase zinc-binding domain-containing protein [Archangium sp.]MDP3569647.1 transposase zinc-binding domain-containing protein [Archangium sp.]